MEKQKRWQFYLIVAVLALTVYNILPTVFYYTNPLRSPIDVARSNIVAAEITERINYTETEAKEWLQSFAHLLKIKPTEIASKNNNPGLIEVSFSTQKEADLFKHYLPRAGAYIPFVPSQLGLYPEEGEKPNSVLVERQIGIKIAPDEIQKIFHFIPKQADSLHYSKGYQEIVFDRAENLAYTLENADQNSELVKQLLANPTDASQDDKALALAAEIVDAKRSFLPLPSLQKSYYATFVPAGMDSLAPKLAQRLEAAKQNAVKSQAVLISEQKKLTEEGLTLDPSKSETLASIEHRIQILDQAIAIVKKDSDSFKQGQTPMTREEISQELAKGYKKISTESPIQILSLKGSNPFVEALIINWSDDSITLKLSKDVSLARQKEVTSEDDAFLRDKTDHYLLNEIARVGRETDEILAPSGDTFAIRLSQLTDPKSFLQLNLEPLAAKKSQQIQDQLLQGFHPSNSDLRRENYPIRSFADYLKEKPEDQRFGLVIYAPSMDNAPLKEGFKPSSIYVIARGFNTITQKYQGTPGSQENKLLSQDIAALNKLMQNMKFIGYSGASYGIAPEFARDYIFELNDYYGNILKASRENFEVKGSKRFALLPYTDVEQRIITRNKIDDQYQDDLLKWVESYESAALDYDPSSRYLVPAPTENPYWSNFKISFAKYFRGDDRKILKWGLDLAGGKTVRIGLVDHNNQQVKNPDDLRMAVNELYTRINSMGVSERTIRIENSNIVLEFPGSQALSASELVKASAMYFHIVNEKFSPSNPSLRDSVQHFLQNVWNQAVVTNRKDIDSIREIAWQHLGGETLNEDKPRPISEHARILYENGLRLSNPAENKSSNAFNDTLSTVARMRGDDFNEWDGQSHPLLFVFSNFALEGSSLTNVHVGYDSTDGNNLSFNIKGSYDGLDRAGSPRDDFYAWTSHFAEDKVAGTANEAYSHGRGWRMAVILNGSVISKPALRAALRDSATITGRFTTREVNQLAADLKAGSLSFTPKILSEQNVSAELGIEERTRGIGAAILALLLVVGAMIAYYRFAGLVASCAVILNILIMWGVLQNLDAALTLPTIAGIVLTIGMAVDANVLVFERVREEFAVSGRIASAIQAGYRKAFSAIVDSNITTIIAALILTQFDSGPIKGFAVSLIVGIISSMFTSLFMTRYYFAGWVKNPAHKQLTMAQFFSRTNFDFLKYAKPAITISVVLALLGVGLLYAERKTIFGMDFTGGYAMNVEVEPKPESGTTYRQQAYAALLQAGASARDVQVRELSKPNQLKIQLGMGMEEKNQPFYQMAETLEDGKFAYPYQSNPRLTWAVKALETGGFTISDYELMLLDDNWSVMSGQLSDTMRNNALIALSLALLSVLIYITFRFEFKYAAAAVIGLAHDVVLTLGVLALFHAMGFLVQIDLQVIGAIMTIIGYSLNDTIIVFDRVREDIRLYRKLSFPEIINHALNVTLSRTVMTSGTTMLVLLALVLFGGHSIFAFSLVMTIGVVIGTFSSLFIAAPTLLFLHNKELREADSQLLSKRS